LYHILTWENIVENVKPCGFTHSKELNSFFFQLFLTIIFPQENKFKKMLIPINNINMQKFTRDLQYQNSQNLLKKI